MGLKSELDLNIIIRLLHFILPIIMVGKQLPLCLTITTWIVNFQN